MNEEWEKEVLANLVEGFKEKGEIANILLLKLKDGKKDAIPLAMPDDEMEGHVMNVVRAAVKEHKNEIEELALIINAWATEVPLGEKMPTKEELAKTEKMVVVLFEHRTGSVMKTFHVNGKKLTEFAYEGKMAENGLLFGLKEVAAPDYGGMYG